MPVEAVNLAVLAPGQLQRLALHLSQRCAVIGAASMTLIEKLMTCEDFGPDARAILKDWNTFIRAAEAASNGEILKIAAPPPVAANLN